MFRLLEHQVLIGLRIEFYEEIFDKIEPYALKLLKRAPEISLHPARVLHLAYYEVQYLSNVDTLQNNQMTRPIQLYNTPHQIKRISWATYLN